jgi:dTDP-4-dehydrorhamnose reductase
MTGPLLVFGAGGQVGRELVEIATLRGIPVVGVTRAEADVADADAVRARIALHRPAVIVNAAAHTAVDRAESEPEAAWRTNAVGAGALATASAEARAPLIQLSTDYVFDGTKPGAYTENDPVAPLSAYGRSKAEGEAMVRRAHPHHLILRTAWAFGAHGNNFLKTILRLAGEQDELRVVADQVGSPTAAVDIAEAILATVPKLVADPSLAGTYHFTGSGTTTWYGFACEIVARQRPVTGRNPRVVAIATGDHPAAARRPRNSVLDCSRFHATFGYVARPWQERTAEVTAALLRSATVAAS